MKLVIKEKQEKTQEGLKTALAGLGAAGALATAGAGMHDYAKTIDSIASVESKLIGVQGPRLASAYKKATGKDFKPVYSNYKGELRAAVAGLIASGKLSEKDVVPQK